MLIFQFVIGGPVYLPGCDSGTSSRHGCTLGSFYDVEYLLIFIIRSAKNNRTGNIRTVTLYGATPVHQDDVPGLEVMFLSRINA